MYKINAHQAYICFFFLLFKSGYLSLSSICISAPLSLFVSYTCTQRRRCAALWQQPVSSVNDLWRVSRCVSLGSFRFVSTELYLRAPFMCPQVWLPSPLWIGGGGGRVGSCQIPPLPLWRTEMESPWAWGHCLTVEFRVLRESSAARKTVSSFRHIVCTIFLAHAVFIWNRFTVIDCLLVKLFFFALKNLNLWGNSQKAKWIVASLIFIITEKQKRILSLHRNYRVLWCIAAEP